MIQVHPKSLQWPAVLYGLLLVLQSANIASAAPKVAALPMEGTVVDAQTAKPVPGAVVSALWLTKQASAPLLMAFRQVRCDHKGRFKIPAWGENPAAAKKPAGAIQPLLRLYATGYRRLEYRDTGTLSRHNATNGQSLKLRPLAPLGGDTLVSVLQPAREKELSAWRNDVDTVAKSPHWHNDINKALVAQADLVRLIAKNCLLLEPDRRQQLCLAPSSTVAEYLRTTRLEVAAQTTLQPTAGMLVAVPTADPEEAPPESRNRVITGPPPAPIMSGASPR